jgi:hypothetical protein
MSFGNMSSGQMSSQQMYLRGNALQTNAPHLFRTKVSRANAFSSNIIGQMSSEYKSSEQVSSKLMFLWTNVRRPNVSGQIISGQMSSVQMPYNPFCVFLNTGIAICWCILRLFKNHMIKSFDRISYYTSPRAKWEEIFYASNFLFQYFSTTYQIFLVNLQPNYSMNSNYTFGKVMHFSVQNYHSFMQNFMIQFEFGKSK